MDVPEAYSDRSAAEATGIPVERIRFWETTDALRPSIATGWRRSPWWRMYDFRDIVGLRVLHELRERHGVPLRELRRVGRYLAAHRDTPWSALGIAVSDRHVWFRDAAMGRFEPGPAAGKHAVTLDLTGLAHDVEVEAAKLLVRRPDEIGRIVQTRTILGGASRLAGTRIPTSAVWNFHEDGSDAEEIMAAYPSLVREDIEAALDYERKRRGLPAA
jgi:uncharacterized protein (DUF433 family)